ncbi:AraC family transcriptional regulator [Acidovorax sp. SUPP2825]|uniref:AraC family transcriptional regulator n=1 Tax=Acidovorax sp. SUPP2825 TaxID=2920879 RepID=UPI0023DE3A4E|nr:AraC family transcriptional regulator [Acidovorax sp. SUPP2825]GKS93467.1 AraC family transcriptional regulator [Acidovorax sp. SUPP2825]
MTQTETALQNRAIVPPMLIRALLRVAQARGLPPDRLCLGLGFGPEDLRDPALRVSYRQTRALCKRVQAQLNEPSLGLLAGQAQTPLSWGLPGLAMLTCQTLGQAIAFCAVHQSEAGALVSFRIERQDGLLVVEAQPRYHDPELEPLLIEEAFAASLTVVRALVGADFTPERVELAWPAPAHTLAHRRVFGCNVQFDRPAHRMWTSQRWLAQELPGWDPYACDALREHLAALLECPGNRNDLHESALTWLRGNLDNAPSMAGLARHLNLGERTLRRRLDALGVSWRALHDQVRRDHALALLQRAALPIHEVASATGFDDLRAFRRAFKRWTGARPSALRQR